MFTSLAPVTSRKLYVAATVPGTDQAAWRAAERELTRLQHEVDQRRVVTSTVLLSEAMAEWLRTSELEDSTRKTYAGYLRRTIDPALGRVSNPQDRRALARELLRRPPTLPGEV